jgi:hypothetical protein
MSDMQRFTVYRHNMDSRETHSAMHKNPEDSPQYEGVIFSDGTVALRWMTPLRSTSIWPDIESALGVHGHPEYGTVIDWHDGEPHPCWTQAVAAYEALTAEDSND